MQHGETICYGGSKFYGKFSEMLFFLGKRGRKTVEIARGCSSSNILQI